MVIVHYQTQVLTRFDDCYRSGAQKAELPVRPCGGRRNGPAGRGAGERRKGFAALSSRGFRTDLPAPKGKRHFSACFLDEGKQGECYSQLCIFSRNYLRSKNTEENTQLSLIDFKSCPRDFLIKPGLQIDQIIFKKELDDFLQFQHWLKFFLRIKS